MRGEPFIPQRQPFGNRPLQRRGRCKGDELMAGRDLLGQFGRGHRPTDLPPGQRKDLARRPDLHRPIPQSRNIQHRQRFGAIKDSRLPHFIGQDVKPVLLSQSAHALQRRAVQNGAGRIVGRVQDDQPRPVGNSGGQIIQIQAPRRRAQVHQPRHAARPRHQRQIGVIKRLNANHLITRLYQRQNRTGQSLGRAGCDDHLCGRNAVKPRHRRA
jgi:hypothetical protein